MANVLHMLVVLLVQDNNYDSSEHISTTEIFGSVYILAIDCPCELTYIPEEIFLEYTLTSNTEFWAEGIQTWFSCVWLPTSIKYCERGVINHSNFVAVEIYSRHTVVSNNLCVSRWPVLVCLDSGVHLLFDLSQNGVRLVDFYTIQEQGAITTPCVPLSQLASCGVSLYVTLCTLLSVNNSG